MKTKNRLTTTIFTFFLLLGTTSLISQNAFPSFGNAGIGTGSQSPRFGLHMSNSNALPGIIFTTSSNFFANGVAAVGLAVNSGGYFPTASSGDFAIRGQAQRDIVFGTMAFPNSLDGNERMRIKNNGNVGIGTTNPDEKLTVNGTVHAEEVRVDLSVPPDYVFQMYYTGSSTLKEDYTMPTLEELEMFVKMNHHLPDVPSAANIQKEGLFLKEMSALLLQKIEELTLYILEQEKKIQAVSDVNKQLQRQIEGIKKNNH